MKKKYSVFLLLPCFCFAVTQETKECVSIDDPSERLACYDSLFRNTQVNPGDSIEIAPSDGSQAIAATPQDTRKQEFGLPKSALPNNDPIQIKSTIIKLKQLSNMKVDITLANGQKWRSSEKVRRGKLKLKQEVVISEGFISGFVLKVLDQKTAIRVRRLK